MDWGHRDEEAMRAVRAGGRSDGARWWEGVWCGLGRVGGRVREWEWERVGATGGKGACTSCERVGTEGRVERGGRTGEVTVEGWWSWGE